MKKRDVILDFTSLLDVTLIVIFFFVIFSHLDTEDNRAKTEAKVAELETAIEEAEEREAAASGAFRRPAFCARSFPLPYCTPPLRSAARRERRADRL